MSNMDATYLIIPMTTLLDWGQNQGVKIKQGVFVLVNNC